MSKNKTNHYPAAFPAARAKSLQYYLVEMTGVEPATPGLQSQCSPN